MKALSLFSDGDVHSFFFNEQALPLVISPKTDNLILPQWLSGNMPFIEKKLLEYGGILFRGFDTDTLEKFQAVVNCFNTAPLPYMFRSSPRKEIKEDVKNIYHSTLYPNHRHIELHNESSYSRVWGMKIMFCCLKKPSKGGETPICDIRNVLTDIHPTLADKFRTKGIKYTRNLFPNVGLSWKEVFQTSDKEEMISVCNKYQIKYHFHNENKVTISWVKPAIYRHPGTNEEVWFNHCLLFSQYSLYEILGLSENDVLSEDMVVQDTSFGDDSLISYEEYQLIKNAYKKNKKSFPYSEGDILLLDNMLCAHGRNPYHGDRLVATTMIEPFYDKGFEKI